MFLSVNVFSMKLFYGTTCTAPRTLKFYTNVGYDLLYCEKENRPAHAYSTIYLPIFLSLQYSRGAPVFDV